MRRRPHRDPVDPAEAIAVFERDGCVAVKLGEPPSDCSGRLTIDHIKAEPRMGRRGSLLVSVCEGHSEPGARAGYQWNTAHRPEIRKYLRSAPAVRLGGLS